MSKIIRLGVIRWANQISTKTHHIQTRSFLSNAYQCNEVWDARLHSSILQKINYDTFYYELDLNYQKNKNISAIDVDIFANSCVEDTHVDEVLDLVYKLRQSADTGNALESTSHAVYRILSKNGHYDKLLDVLDDRLNYGVFLDYYSANVLFDTFWKNKDYMNGARLAAQFMLQEDFDHPLTLYFSLLHCFKYLQQPGDWPKQPVIEEPEEEVKVRVKYIRNPYFDDHFDLKDPNHLLGKTIWMAGRSVPGILGTSFQIAGLALHEKFDAAKSHVESVKNNPVLKQIIDLIPEGNEIKNVVSSLTMQEDNVEKLLIGKIEEVEQNCAEKDIADQCKLLQMWEQKRVEALEEQKQRITKAQKLTEIEKAQATLKEKEMKLWFFDREEQLELDIEAKRVFYPKRWFGKKKKPRAVDQDYVPPEVQASHSKKT